MAVRSFLNHIKDLFAMSGRSSAVPGLLGFAADPVKLDSLEDPKLLIDVAIPGGYGEIQCGDSTFSPPQALQNRSERSYADASTDENGDFLLECVLLVSNVSSPRFTPNPLTSAGAPYGPSTSNLGILQLQMTCET